MKYYLLLALLVLFSCDDQKQTITMSSLLEEMCNRETLARFPDPAYVTKQFSSYDRASVSKDSSSWYANWDRSQFIRTEQTNGRREFVMFDADGPGAIVRFWVTVADYSDRGVLRFYLDGAETPVIEGEVLQLISGGMLAAAPLSTSVSELTDYKQRGHNLYLPIPYARHCKVTYESPGIKEPGEFSGECFYYNINYRTYESGTSVQTFTKEDLKIASQTIEEVQGCLKKGEIGVSAVEEESEEFALVENDSTTLLFEGEGAIRQLSVKLRAEQLPQALRSLILHIRFDNNETVWAPVGDFFGTGNRLSPYQTYYTKVSSDTTLTCYWVMPYQKKCEVTLLNTRPELVKGNLKVCTSSWSWDDRSMYFGAGWTEYTHQYTGMRRDMKGTSDQLDVNFVKLTGKGVYVGDGVTLFNPVGDWWGEGDEKIYIDNEAFPSHFGTGTEDYYGYAWCMPARFEHPFIAQPDGTGDLNPGHVSNVRFRALDAIPFKKSLVFDMEIWHWASTRVNYAPITFWYMLPGGTSNRTVEPAKAKAPVALHKNDLVSNIPDEQGLIEGENLNVSLTGGEEKSQTLPFMKWSNLAQFFWKDSKEGDKAHLTFNVNKAGTYHLQIHLTKAPDYGRYKILLNGAVVKPSFDAYSEQLTTQLLGLGTVPLLLGDNCLTFVQLAPNPKAINNFLGIDYLLVK